uniref:Uncharacterized protein n=1 Tax=Arundo donax TaxID=35708 RepID=A0A0A9BXD4_ARUDO
MSSCCVRRCISTGHIGLRWLQRMHLCLRTDRNREDLYHGRDGKE